MERGEAALDTGAALDRAHRRRRPRRPRGHPNPARARFLREPERNAAPRLLGWRGARLPRPASRNRARSPGRGDGDGRRGAAPVRIHSRDARQPRHPDRAPHRSARTGARARGDSQLRDQRLLPEDRAHRPEAAFDHHLCAADVDLHQEPQAPGWGRRPTTRTGARAGAPPGGEGRHRSRRDRSPCPAPDQSPGWRTGRRRAHSEVADSRWARAPGRFAPPGRGPGRRDHAAPPVAHCRGLPDRAPPGRRRSAGLEGEPQGVRRRGAKRRGGCRDPTLPRRNGARSTLHGPRGPRKRAQPQPRGERQDGRSPARVWA